MTKEEKDFKKLLKANQESCGRLRSPKVNAFLAEIAEVCFRHQLQISHEDSQGGFEIISYTPKSIGKIYYAADRSKE